MNAQARAQRHMKGKQVPLTMYLPPQKYWRLKAASLRSGLSMQHLLRAALDKVLMGATARGSQRAR